MKIKYAVLVLFLIPFFFACSEDNDVTTPRNLEEYIATVSNQDFGEVIACAASADGNKNLSYIFYYPEDGATDIRYYEAESVDDDPNDFSNYKRELLTISNVFGSKLQRFSRSNSTESWCLVTYMLNGKLHKSNPIRLKNSSSSTTWTDNVSIEYTTQLEPKFTWTDVKTADDKIYFQVISETEDDEFISGTYTEEATFQYFDASNIVLNINVPETPSDLEIDTEYLFTMMAVSEDNWVNTVVQENFVLENLQEFLDSESVNTTKEITSFAASAEGNDNLSYIYFYPETNARDFRYYETDSIGTTIDKNDFTNYRRKMLTSEAVFGAKFRRFSWTDNIESWYIVTYEIDEVIYKTKPIQLKNKSQKTVYKSEIKPHYPQTLKPLFTWEDYTTSNDNYLHLITDKNSAFVSGIYTKEKSFQYYDTTNATPVNTDTPPDLVLEDQYKCTIMGLSSDNWVNLIIQDSFVVE